MKISIELRPSQLKILSSFLVNIAAGLFLLILTTNHLFVLTANIGLAILFLGMGVRIEDLLENL